MKKGNEQTVTYIEYIEVCKYAKGKVLKLFCVTNASIFFLIVSVPSRAYLHITSSAAHIQLHHLLCTTITLKRVFEHING